MEQLYAAFVANGASLAEINPLVTTPDGRVLALDAKIVIDDNELFWRPDLGLCATTPPKSRAKRRRGGRTCRSSSSTAMSAAS